MSGGEELSKGGNSVGPNRPANGEGRWNGVGEVGDAGWWEDWWDVSDEVSNLGELKVGGRGEAARQEDE